MKKWWSSQYNAKQFSHQSRIILTLWNPRHSIRIHQNLQILPLWSHITGGIQHWMVDSPKKLVTCGILNMRSAHQNSMNSSSRHNSKDTLIWTSITSTTTSRCVSMRWLDSDNTYFLLTSPSKYTLNLKNTLSQILIILPILGVFRYTLPLDTHCYWQWLLTPV